MGTIALAGTLVVLCSAAPASPKPISESSPKLFEALSSDGLGPALRLSLGGLSTDLVRGDCRWTVELTTGLRARTFIVWHDVHVMVEADIYRWRASLTWGGWRPVTDLGRLEDRLTAGVDAVHGYAGEVPRLFSSSMSAITARTSPWARPMRVAYEALDSLYDAALGWTAGIDVFGRMSALGSASFDPLYEVQATLTLIF